MFLSEDHEDSNSGRKFWGAKIEQKDAADPTTASGGIGSMRSDPMLIGGALSASPEAVMLENDRGSHVPHFICMLLL